MKQKLFFFAAAMMAFALPLTAQDYDFTAVSPSGHTLYYTIDGNDVQVAGPGWIFIAFSPDPRGDLIIPSSVSYNGTTYNVTSIKNHGFALCHGISRPVCLLRPMWPDTNWTVRFGKHPLP